EVVNPGIQLALDVGGVHHEADYRDRHQQQRRERENGVVRQRRSQPRRLVLFPLLIRGLQQVKQLLCHRVSRSQHNRSVLKSYAGGGASANRSGEKQGTGSREWAVGGRRALTCPPSLVLGEGVGGWGAM